MQAPHFKLRRWQTLPGSSELATELCTTVLGANASRRLQLFASPQSQGLPEGEKAPRNARHQAELSETSRALGVPGPVDVQQPLSGVSSKCSVEGNLPRGVLVSELATSHLEEPHPLWTS